MSAQENLNVKKNLEELGIPKLHQILQRRKPNLSLKNYASTDEYEHNCGLETDEEGHREKLLVPDQEVECKICDST